MFCYPCRQFSITKASDIFCSVGFTNWSKALAKNVGFKQHDTSNVHLSAIVAWKEHTLRLANNLEISKLVNETVLEKRQYYVKEIISTVWFLAKNECAFRGNWDAQNHDESGLFQILQTLASKRRKKVPRNDASKCFVFITRHTK